MVEIDMVVFSHIEGLVCNDIFVGHTCKVIAMWGQCFLGAIIEHACIHENIAS